MLTRRFRVLFGLLVAVAVVVVVAAGWTVEARRHRSTLELADREIAAGRFGAARQRLIGLSTRWMGPSEVDYRLGLCEVEELGLLRDHIAVDFESLAVDAFRILLGRASQQAPEDDRVWLAWANLAIQTGQFAGARRRLDDCLGRRPEDPAVWQAVLD
jgi:predicted Zn-dependent protease